MKWTRDPLFRVVAGITLGFLCWVGSAQTAVAVYGKDDNIIIVIAMIGMIVGIGLCFRLVETADWPEEKK